MDIDLVGHQGGNTSGEDDYTLKVTDLATDGTENRSMCNKAQPQQVVAALDDIASVMPFPVCGGG
ncbi:hypothetical protein [Nocardia sp. NPDC052316]|uniref:hypothetical protein n=1 Tax=Nocardia sp. NPDC052316 TaxID=3364329 RepID=UPI0037C885FA